MISVEECKKYLDGVDLSDEEIVVLRDSLYATIESLLERLFEIG